MGDSAVKLPILAGGPSWLALCKPAGAVSHPHPLFPAAPALTVALRRRGRSLPPPACYSPSESPAPQSAFLLEPESEGVVLIGWDPEWLRRVREDIGSSLVSFRFLLIAVDRRPEASSERHCELPIRHQHGVAPPARVSHRHGKKARTFFTQLHRWEETGLSLWQACSDYLRPFQIRLHAFESGLEIPGDPLWGATGMVSRDLFYRRREVERRPFFDGLPIFLSEVQFTGATVVTDGLLRPCITCPPPRKWGEFVRKAGPAPIGFR